MASEVLASDLQAKLFSILNLSSFRTPDSTDNWLHTDAKPSGVSPCEAERMREDARNDTEHVD